MTAKKHIKHWKFAVVHKDDLGDFKPIPNTGGMYQISKDGVVVSSRHRGLPDDHWIVLKTQKSRVAHPFNRVMIYFDGRDKPNICQISRLILEAWVGPPPSPLHIAAHRNGVSDDDRLENLLWATSKDVKYGSICRGTWVHGESAATSRFSEEQVVAARRIVVEYGVPANLLATAMGLPQQRVREWLTKTWDSTKWDGLTNPLEPTDGQNAQDTNTAD